MYRKKKLINEIYNENLNEYLLINLISQKKKWWY